MSSFAPWGFSSNSLCSKKGIRVFSILGRIKGWVGTNQSNLYRPSQDVACHKILRILPIFGWKVDEVFPFWLGGGGGIEWKMTYIDRNGMGHTIAHIHNKTGCSSTGIQRKHTPNFGIHRGGVESFEHNLSHLLPIGLRVQRTFTQQHRVLFGCHTEFVVEGMMPDLNFEILRFKNTLKGKNVLPSPCRPS